MGATDEDPFAIFLTPPPNETAGERAAREAEEAEAKRVSDEIDIQLKADKALMKKQKNVVRVLLLGQSESGKSTTLKNFRMRFARAEWEAEKASWQSVVHLNLVRSIITIVEVLQAEIDGEPIDTPMTPTTPKTPITPSLDHFLYASSSSAGQSSDGINNFASPRPGVDEINPNPLAKAPLSSILTDRHQLLKLRLGPLRRVESDLKKRLGAGADEEEDGAAAANGILDESLTPTKKRPKREFSVRRLKDALESGFVSSTTSRTSCQNGADPDDEERVDELTKIIAECKDDMKALWADEAVRVILKRRKVRMEESAGFFLDDLDRIASTTYEPSDDDVIRARLRTIGVQEYKIQLDNGDSAVFSGGIGGEFGRDWLLFDVGGSRTMRHAWVPFFENVNAIIFLAPISCFDERLSEDSKINRLEDSFLLWRTICSSKILARTSIILFLNKCDLLRRKLKAGIKIKSYLPSYGDRSNDVNTAVKYLREKFKEILKQHSPEPRLSYFYATSVIDTKATSSTIKAVKDCILRDYLKSADFV